MRTRQLTRPLVAFLARKLRLLARVLAPEEEATTHTETAAARTPQIIFLNPSSSAPEATPSPPPRHWQQPIEGQPPAHWVEVVRRKAPQLLDPRWSDNHSAQPRDGVPTWLPESRKPASHLDGRDSGHLAAPKAERPRPPEIPADVRVLPVRPLPLPEAPPQAVASRQPGPAVSRQQSAEGQSTSAPRFSSPDAHSPGRVSFRAQPRVKHASSVFNAPRDDKDDPVAVRYRSQTAGRTARPSFRIRPQSTQSAASGGLAAQRPVATPASAVPPVASEARVPVTRPVQWVAGDRPSSTSSPDRPWTEATDGGWPELLEVPEAASEVTHHLRAMQDRERMLSEQRGL
ncbi:MAG: hypothetical protein JWN34_4668 [Bryobacterales bacterium]|nr:hypothetical protein [Bryobacterales bacterium]